MKKYFHNLVVSVISRIFDAVKLPEELIQIKSQLPQTVLITQSHSLVIEGLLQSFAKRLGLNSVSRLQEPILSHIMLDPGSQLSPLCWASMHDIAKIAWPDSCHVDNGIKVRTLNVFQVKGPIRKWPSFKPSNFWLWGLIPTRRILTVTVGEAITFSQQSSQRLQRMIKIDFVRTLKLVRGSPFEPREEQARAILTGPEFERELRIISERNGVSLAQGKKLAEKAFYELAASPRRFMYDALSFVAKIVVSRLFSEVNTRGLEKLIPAIKEHTVVLVPMHRSHLDYVLVGYKLFSEKVNPPLVAAGINLAFWPFGFLFRSVGAYFVKRNARDRFHTIVLKRYVAYLVARGHLQEFFIEGGRSRSGKMLPPKLGLLSIIVESWRPERTRDILFVPVSITYENVIEDEAFSKENSGSSKVRESIGSTIKAFSVFRKRYGEVLIEFGEPISHRNFREKILQDPQNKISEKAATQKLGYELCRSIRDQSNPGLTSLCYTSLLIASRYGLSKLKLINRINSLHSYLELLRSSDCKIGTDTPQLQRFISGETDTLNDLANSGVVRPERQFGIDYYFIPGSRRFTADYYRNSVLHYFFHLSLFAVCELSYSKIDQNSLQKLYPFFEHDLLLEPWNEFWNKTSKLLEILQSAGILELKNDVLTFCQNRKDLFIPSLLSSHMQAYQWVSKSLLEASNNEDFDKDNLRYERFVGKMLSGAKVASYVGTISRTEAAARSTIITILSSLEARNLIKFTEGSGVDKSISLDNSKIQELSNDIATLDICNRSINRWMVDE